MDRRDLQVLSKVRLKEAKFLLNAGLHDGAYYLAGYAVECGLKACIAKKTRRYEFPDKKAADRAYTHRLEALVVVADLEQALRDHARMDAQFGKHWNEARVWSEESRYARHVPQDAQRIVNAIADQRHGIMKWLRLHW